jgi:hypothetical protein
MPELNNEEMLEATEEQLAMLRDLGIANADLEELSFADAEEWIAELRGMREDAGKIGRD